MTIAIIVLAIVGGILLLGSVGLVWMAFSGPSSTGNGAGIFGSLIYLGGASITALLGGLSLVASVVLLFIKHFA